VGEEHAWEAGAEQWVELVRTGDGNATHDAILRELLPPPSGLLVDAGCGEGRWVRELRTLGYDVLGVDRSEKLIRTARDGDPDGCYQVGTLEKLPVADGAAAVVLSVNVLMHVVELDVALREFARVLAPGGTLVLGLTHPVMEAGTFDDETEDLRLSGYFANEEHAVPLGEHHVAHQHRTIEGYVRPLLAAGFALDDLREVPGRTGGIPRYLDLRLTRS
jgi:SAM-dependent methyltransferase